MNTLIIIAILIIGCILLFFPSAIFIIAAMVTSKLFWQIWFWTFYSLIIVACVVGMIAFVRQWGGAEEWKFFK